MPSMTADNEEFSKGYAAGFKAKKCPPNASAHFRDGYKVGSYEIACWIIFGAFPANEKFIPKYRLRTDKE